MFSCVLRVLFPLVKTGISPTATTVSGVFATKGKIALCAGGYNRPASDSAEEIVSEIPWMREPLRGCHMLSS